MWPEFGAIAAPKSTAVSRAAESDSGLGWSIIFRLVPSAVFTLFAIPVTYWLVYARRPAVPAKAVEAAPEGRTNAG